MSIPGKNERLLLDIFIPGRPVTKKNSPVPIAQKVQAMDKALQKVSKHTDRINLAELKKAMVEPKERRIILPSPQYRQYAEVSSWEIRKQYKGPVIDETVRAGFYYTLPNWRWFPDLVGLFQATGDILQDNNILKNDRLIVNYGDSRIVGIDKTTPGVRIILWTSEGICLR